MTGRLGQVERPQLHRDPRMSAPERGQQRGPDLPAGGQAQPDRQLTGPRGRGVARRGDPAFQRRQRLVRAVEEGFTGRGQQHAPAGPLQQLDAERLLELADLRAEHLLGHVHATRRGGEARFLRHGDEVPEMPQFDVHGAHIVTADPRAGPAIQPHAKSAARTATSGRKTAKLTAVQTEADGGSV
jgi:hypothetical protein